MSLDLEHKIFIAGASGMVGSALVRLLQKEGYYNLLTPSHAVLDLTNQTEVHTYLQENRPDLILIAAAKVGGIYANMTYPAEFLYQNLQIATHLIHGAHLAGINRLLFLGSSCIYPRLAPQPIHEESLLTGPLEPTNEAYALAKIAGIKMCQFYRQQYGRDYISAMPTNLYGSGDNYHPENSHVIAALLRRFHKAKEDHQNEVVIWGTGTPKREFLHVDDLAEAVLFLIKYYHDSIPINIGSDEEVTIAELAQLIAGITGFKGKLIFDPTKPDGTPRKKCDVSRIKQLGWCKKISLKEGLKWAYIDFMRCLINA